MKNKLLALLTTTFIALPALSQEKADRIADPDFMAYFDEAYSVLLDLSNRCAGIKDLTGPETIELWTPPADGPADYDISFDNSVMTIAKTLTSTDANWESVDLNTLSNMQQKGSLFAHIAEEKGEEPAILTGMFVDMTIDGQVVMNLTVKTDTDCQLRVDLADANGRQANGKASYNYRNSQRIDLYARDGWADIELTWSDPLFDYYSGSYWGVTNGMRDNSAPLWVWTDSTKKEKREYTIEEETPIPVSMQTISKIMLTIDDGEAKNPGAIGDTKTLQIKDLSLGRTSDAVNFKAVNQQNLERGDIIYNPENAVKVKARQDINAKPEPDPVIIDSIPDFYFTSYAKREKLELYDYFSAEGAELTFTISISDSANIFNAKVNDSHLRFNSNYKQEGTTTIQVTATNKKGHYVTQSFKIVYEESAPKLIKEIDYLEFESDFEQYQIDLNDYFENGGKGLTYSILTENYLFGQIFAYIEGSVITITKDEKDFPCGAMLTITATNESNESNYEITKIVVKQNDTTKPFFAEPLPKLTLEKGFGAVTPIDLNKIFCDPKGGSMIFRVYVLDGKCTESNYIIAFEQDGLLHIEENEIGSGTVYIEAFNEDNVEFLSFEVEVLEKGNIAPTTNHRYNVIDSDLEDSIVAIYLPNYFTDSDSLDFSLDPIVDGYWIDLSGDSLLIRREMANDLFLIVFAEDKKGGFCKSYFSIFAHEKGYIGPQIKNKMTDIEIDVNKKSTIDLHDFFSTSGEMEYKLYKDKDYIADLSEQSDGIFEFSPISKGTIEITAIVSDSYGGHAEQRFNVMVSGERKILVSSTIHINKDTIAVFPTVFSETVTIEGAHGAVATVSNMAGTVVFRSAIFGQSARIDLSNLAKGIYLLQVGGKTERIIKE